MEVVNVNLAKRAQTIARDNNISFGEALSQARREMADIVGGNDGSPLRGKETAATPPPSEVRTAVIAGLQAVAPTWKTDGDWVATSGATVLRQACASVAGKLDELGMGSKIISAMGAYLFSYLNLRVLELSCTGTLSDLISQAADHVVSSYEQALANKVATQRWSESQVAFAEKVAQGAGSYVLMDSVVLRDKAMEVSRDRGVSFGEALRIVRHSFASDVVQPDALKSAVVTALRDKFGSMLQGKKKVLSSFDLDQVLKAATDAVSKLNISGHAEVSDAMKQSLQGKSSGETAFDPGDVEAIVAKAATSAARAYSKHLSSVS